MATEKQPAAEVAGKEGGADQLTSGGKVWVCSVKIQPSGGDPTTSATEVLYDSFSIDFHEETVDDFKNRLKAVVSELAGFQKYQIVVYRDNELHDRLPSDHQIAGGMTLYVVAYGGPSSGGAGGESADSKRRRESSGSSSSASSSAKRHRADVLTKHEDEDIASVLTRLCHCVPDQLVPGNVIDLSMNKLPQLEGLIGLPHDGRIYIRRCYVLLLEQLETMLQEGEAKVLITGTPGIGKSVFFWLFLVQYLKRGKEVVVQFKAGNAKSFRLVVPHKTEDLKVTVQVLDKNDAFMVGRDLLLLADGRLKFTQRQTVMVCSPSELKKLRQLAKIAHQNRLYVPRWGLEELLDAHSKLNLEKRAKDPISAREVEERFRRWNGIARAAFCWNADDQGDMWGNAIKKAKGLGVITLLNQIGVSLSESKHSATVDTLVQIVPDDETSGPAIGRGGKVVRFRSFKRQIASREAYEAFLDSYVEVLRSEQEYFLHVCRAPEAAALAGNLFEAYIRRSFTNERGDFELIALLDADGKGKQPKDERSAAPTLRMRVGWSRNDISRLEDLADGLKEEVLYWPIFRTLESGDGFVWCPPVLNIFQVTVARDHAIKQNGLQRIIDLVPVKMAGFEVRLIFVVPKYVFSSYDKKQKYTEQGGHISKRIPAEVKSVKQFVMAAGPTSFPEQRPPQADDAEMHE